MCIFKNQNILGQMNLTFSLLGIWRQWLSTHFYDAAGIPVCFWLKTHLCHFMVSQHLLGSPLNRSIPSQTRNGGAVDLQSPGQAPDCRRGAPQCTCSHSVVSREQRRSHITANNCAANPPFPSLQTFCLLAEEFTVYTFPLEECLIALCTRSL